MNFREFPNIADLPPSFSSWWKTKWLATAISFQYLWIKWNKMMMFQKWLFIQHTLLLSQFWQLHWTVQWLGDAHGVKFIGHWLWCILQWIHDHTKYKDINDVVQGHNFDPINWNVYWICMHAKLRLNGIVYGIYAQHHFTFTKLMSGKCPLPRGCLIHSVHRTEGYLLKEDCYIQ